MEKISVLVPIYGVERYIERCAKSLFNQSYPDLEYVFVNDNTPDDSIPVLQKVLKNYPDRARAVKIVNHEKNRGLAAARNTALDNATGDFVCIVDSDDWLEENAVELLVKRQLETGADIVSGGYCEHRNDEVISICCSSLSASDKERRILSVMSGKAGYFIWGRIIRRSLYKENNIRCIEGCNMAEDVRQIIMLSYFANGMSSIDEIVYHYEKRNENSIMHHGADWDKALRNLREHFWNIVSVMDFFSEKERVLYEKAVGMTVWSFKRVLMCTLKCSAKKDFYDLVQWIDRYEDCVQAMGWKKNRVKGAFMHNYYCMRLDYQKNRIFQFLRKKLKKNSL